MHLSNLQRGRVEAWGLIRVLKGKGTMTLPFTGSNGFLFLAIRKASIPKHHLVFFSFPILKDGEIIPIDSCENKTKSEYESAL